MPEPYYLSTDGGATQKGPVSEAELRELLRAGKFSRKTVYWCQGMAEWRPLKERLGRSGGPPTGAVPVRAGAVPQPEEPSFFALMLGPVAATILAALILIGTVVAFPPYPEWNAVLKLGAGIGAWLVVIVLAGLLAFPLAILAAMFVRRFLGPMCKSYSWLVVLLAVIGGIGSVTGRLMNAPEEGAVATAGGGTAGAIGVRPGQATGPGGIEGPGSRIRVDEGQGGGSGSGGGSSSASGDPGERTPDIDKQVEEMVDAFVADVVKVSAEYRAELDAQNLEQVLDPVQFNADRGARKARAAMTNCRNIIRTKERESRALFIQLPNRVRELDIPPAMQEEIILYYRAPLNRIMGYHNELWDADQEIIGQISEAVNLLESTRSRWEPAGKNYRFERKGDLDRLNRIIDKAKALREEKAEIRKRMDAYFEAMDRW